MVIENFERLNEISNLIPDKISNKFREQIQKRDNKATRNSKWIGRNSNL